MRRFIYIACIIFMGCLEIQECPRDMELNYGVCSLKQGCEYNNPGCGADYECMENECVLKEGCLYNNPACENYSECIDNVCMLRPGCQFDNPPCKERYDCVNNSCVEMVGCNYNVPACEENYTCMGNECVYNCDVPEDIYQFTETLEGEKYIGYTTPGSDIAVVCQEPCPMSDRFLKFQYTGLKQVIDELIVLSGMEFNEDVTPIYFHYTSDSVCGQFEDHETGYLKYNEGRAITCIFDYEKENLVVPFTEEYACRRESKILSIHEAAHILVPLEYQTAEQFIGMMSFHIAGYRDYSYQGEYFEYGISACDERMERNAELPYYLCTMYGIDTDEYPEIISGSWKAKERYTQWKGALFNDDFREMILNKHAGEDTAEAFEKAGLSINRVPAPWMFE